MERSFRMSGTAVSEVMVMPPVMVVMAPAVVMVTAVVVVTPAVVTVVSPAMVVMVTPVVMVPMLNRPHGPGVADQGRSGG